jgi:hypothetical protein
MPRDGSRKIQPIRARSIRRFASGVAKAKSLSGAHSSPPYTFIESVGENMNEEVGVEKGLRRPGVLGVHSLDHFALTVPDLAEAAV